MHNFLHQQCQGMNPPTLLDRMEVDDVNANTPTLLKRMQVNNRERRTLLDRLETSDDTPLSFPKTTRTEPALLDRFMMGMEENPIMSTGTNHLTLTGTQGMETILKVNQLNKWTTSPKTSDKTMSQNLTIILILNINTSSSQRAKDSAVKYYGKTLDEIEALSSSASRRGELAQQALQQGGGSPKPVHVTRNISQDTHIDELIFQIS